MAMKWYIVHTQPNCENKAQAALQERIKQMNMEDFFGQILVPSESVIETVKGQKRETVKKFYPGYIFVQMEMNEKAFALVRNTTKISGFLGGKNPTPVTEKTISQVNQHMQEGMQKTKIKISYETGEMVKINEGPFATFSGIIDEVKPDKQKVKVKVTIFGRSTSVELDFSQVQKV